MSSQGSKVTIWYITYLPVRCWRTLTQLLFFFLYIYIRTLTTRLVVDLLNWITVSCSIDGFFVKRLLFLHCNFSVSNMIFTQTTDSVVKRIGVVGIIDRWFCCDILMSYVSYTGRYN